MKLPSKHKKEAPRSRKYVGCLAGCLISLGILVVFLIIIGYFMFRSRPPIEPQAFYTSDMVGFARVQLDELTSHKAGNLLPGLVRRLDGSRQNDYSDLDADSLSKTLHTLFHPNHFFYVYKQGADSPPEFLVVVDIKRFWWFLDRLLKEIKGAEWERFKPPQDIKARCMQLKKPGVERCLAMTGDAMLVANSRSRLEEALLLLESRIKPTPLSDKSRSLLPPKGQTSLIQGFLLWDKQWMEELTDSYLQNYPESEGIHALLEKGRIEGLRFKVNLESPDKLDIQMDLSCPSQANARTLTRVINDFFDEQPFHGELTYQGHTHDRMVIVHLTIYQLTKRLP